MKTANDDSTPILKEAAQFSFDNPVFLDEDLDISFQENQRNVNETPLNGDLNEVTILCQLRLFKYIERVI